MFQIVTVLFKGLGFIKTGGSFLLKNPKILVGFIITVLCLFAYWKISSTISGLREEVTVERTQKEREKNDKEHAIEANAENLATIARLTEERRLAEESSRRLREKIKQDSKTLDELMDRIRVSPPQDDGRVSKVLADTISGIQESRKGR